jgi:hypothetical protein
MKITGQDTTSSSSPAASRQPQRASRRWVVTRTVLAWGLLILVLALGLWGQAQSGTVTSGVRRTVGAGQLIQDPRLQLYFVLQRSKLPTLYLNIEFKDTQRLLADRQGIELTGVHIPTPNDVVTETNVRLGDDVIPVQIQLPAGEYPGAQASQWAFEITTQDKRGVLGWQHLFLYDAASHQALSQWGLSESLRREGILAAPVQAVSVVLNGDALGLYGAWAAPGPDVSADELVYFDPTLYWQDLLRQRGNGPAPLSVRLSDCQVATVTMLNVPVTGTSASGQAAVQSLLDLQLGKRAPSDVLDVERMGTLLALGTLWQGTPINDWTHLAFHLNSATGRLEPVSLADLISSPGDAVLRWPACFDDPILQSAYIQAIERVSRPEYLQQLQAALGNSFQQMQLAWDAGDLTWDELAARQKRMARWLEPMQTVLATWSMLQAAPQPDTTLQVSLSNLQHAPVEVLGFDVGKGTFLPLDPAWIQDSAGVTVTTTTGALVLRVADDGRLHTLRLNVPYNLVFTAGRAWDEPVEMRVITRLWGLTRQQSAPMPQVSGE